MPRSYFILGRRLSPRNIMEPRKSHIIPVIIIVVAISGIGYYLFNQYSSQNATTSPSSNGLKHYQDTKAKLSLDYPVDWEVSGKVQSPEFLRLSMPIDNELKALIEQSPDCPPVCFKGDKFPTISITYYPSISELPKNKFSNYNAKTLDEIVKTDQERNYVKKVDYLVIDGQKAIKTEVYGKIEISVEKDQRIYIIYVDPLNKPDISPVQQSIIDSIKFL